MTTIDPQAAAQSELAAAMIPTPDDVCESLSPTGALYYLEQLAWAVLTLWTAYSSDQQGNDQDADDDLAVTLQQVATIVGSLDATCARIGLIPADAVPPAP